MKNVAKKTRTGWFWCLGWLCCAGCIGTESTSPPMPVGESNGPAEAGTPAAFADVDVPAAAPSDDQPATWGVAIQPGSTAAGETVTVAFKARIAPGWHIYAVDKPTEPQIPTTFTLQLPPGIEEVGNWDIPESHPIESIFAYEGEVVFRRLLKVAADAEPGLKEITCQIGYQTCSDRMCLPPSSETKSVALEVTAP